LLSVHFPTFFTFALFSFLMTSGREDFSGCFPPCAGYDAALAFARAFAGSRRGAQPSFPQFQVQSSPIFLKPPSCEALCPSYPFPFPMTLFPSWPRKGSGILLSLGFFLPFSRPHPTALYRDHSESPFLGISRPAVEASLSLP